MHKMKNNRKIEPKGKPNFLSSCLPPSKRPDDSRRLRAAKNQSERVCVWRGVVWLVCASVLFKNGRRQFSKTENHTRNVPTANRSEVKREKNEFFVYFDGNNSKYEDGSIVINLSKIHFFHFTPKNSFAWRFLTSIVCACVCLCVCAACLLSVSFRYINWHFKNELKMKYCARRLRLSPSLLGSVFKRSTRISSLFPELLSSSAPPSVHVSRNTKTRRQANPIQSNSNRSVTEPKVKQKYLVRCARLLLTAHFNP